ncbi:MAG: glycoside hydrolase family 127 protein [Phycisphaerae bacterium]|nr:glycoside hydrolase family 127 protein [Phycisphaerae bacterium]
MKSQVEKKDVNLVLNSLIEYIELADYAGYDPYDALNSPLIGIASCKLKWVKVAFTQLLRRSPINLRPLLGVKKGHNPKGIGLFLWGYSRLYSIDNNPQYLQKINYLLDLLEKLKSPGYSGNCWGYNFDWQSRTFFRPKQTPTIVNSSFIGHALLDCYDITGNQKSLDMAMSIKDFILNDLHRTKLNDTFCFSYTPVDTAVVHNANMFGASMLIRLNQYHSDPKLIEAAQASLAYSMQHQREDGSWFYADTFSEKWIDSFHTGFNLQALRYFLNAGYAQQYQQAYQKGIDYYANNFFLADGTPKYYHNKTYPIDIHAPAQAIYFFSSMGPQYQELTDKILNWTLNNLYSEKGYFYFRKTKLYTNKIPYMRWTQAWVFHALTEYLVSSRD